MSKCDWCGAELPYGQDDFEEGYVTCSIMCWLKLLDYVITYGKRFFTKTEGN